MEEDKPFFTKSKEKFTTSTIEAWGMLRKHYIGLKGLSARDMPDRKYKKLWDYEQYLIRTMKHLEEIPSLLIILEEEKPLPLEDRPCNPVQYLGPCEAIIKTIADPTGYGSL
jgi:hypothetical protein